MTKHDKELKEARDIQRALNTARKTETRLLYPMEDEGSFIEAVREYKLAIQYLNELIK